MILSSEGRSSGVLSILQDSVFPSAVAPKSLFRFGDTRDCVEDELEDLWFRLDIRQLFYSPNIIFRTLHSSQTNKNYGAEKTPPSAMVTPWFTMCKLNRHYNLLQVKSLPEGLTTKGFLGATSSLVSQKRKC